MRIISCPAPAISSVFMKEKAFLCGETMGGKGYKGCISALRGLNFKYYKSNNDESSGVLVISREAVSRMIPIVKVHTKSEVVELKASSLTNFKTLEGIITALLLKRLRDSWAEILRGGTCQPSTLLRVVSLHDLIARELVVLATLLFIAPTLARLNRSFKE